MSGSTQADLCTTCQGAGEVGSDHGPRACPDCFGEGRRVGSLERLEWRLRDVEKVHAGSGHATCEADVRWLIFELRRSRKALLTILTRCQDEDAGSPLADEIKFVTNQALQVYDPT